jgi:hypothetical protein
MIKINVKEVLESRDQKAKPRPVIKIGTSVKKVETPVQRNGTDVPGAEAVTARVMQSNALVSQCWGAFSAAKIERNKLSSQIHTMVAAGATKSELKDHYEKIESHRPKLVELFDLSRFVERHGHLPEIKKVDEKPVDITSLKYERSRLIDKRCKLQKKIQVGEAKNPARIAEWQLELDQTNAAYNLVDEKIKELEGRA